MNTNKSYSVSRRDVLEGLGNSQASRHGSAPSPLIQINEETPVRAVLRIWQVNPPTAVMDSTWFEIQRRARNYSPSSESDRETWTVWRDFAIAALAASQPRRTQSIGGRLGNFTKHVRINHFDYATVTVGRLFSENSMKITRIYSQKVARMSKPNLAHLVRDLNALREGLLYPPRTFRHPATPGAPMSNDIALVQRAAHHARADIRDCAERVIEWFENSDHCYPAPEADVTRIRYWCIRRNVGDISMMNLRAEHALTQSKKPLSSIDVLGLPNVDATLIRPTTGGANTFRNHLRTDGTVWTIPEIDREHRPEKDNTMQKPLPRNNTEIVKRRGSRAEARRIMKRSSEGLGSPAAQLTPDLENILSTIELRCMDSQCWQSVKPTVTEIMRRSHIRGHKSFSKHIRIVALYIRWAQMAQRDQSLESLLTTSEIEAWVSSGLTDLRSDTKATYRSLIRSIAAHANPNRDAPPIINRIPHRTAKAPYTSWEVTRLEALGRGVARERQRGQILTCIALGLGAGIDSAELVRLNLSAIKDHGTDGIEITITGSANREVWMLPQYWELLRDGLTLLPTRGPLFTPAQLKHNGTVGRLYETVKQIGRHPVSIEQGRMRNTWLCVLMNMPIPLNDLMTAAGLDTARTLGDLLPHAKKATPSSFGSYMHTNE